MTPGPGEKFDYLLKGMKDREKRVESLDSRAETEGPKVAELKPKDIEVVRVEPQNGVESRVSNRESRLQTETESLPIRVESEEPRLKSLEPVVESLDYNVLAEAIDEANRKPKLGVYSPLAAAILRYKAITTPRYSMGSELRAVIEQALKERYPELSEQVEKALAKK
ncbi:MAG: hypothetical protein ABR985_15265 [Methanotrichaceae archaeon]|jgi:hypothetical protein